MIQCLVYTFGTFEHTLCRGKLSAAKMNGVKMFICTHIYTYTRIIYYDIMCPCVLKITSFREIFFRKKTNGGRKI